MANTSLSQRPLPIRHRVFEFSRLQEDCMAAAYAVVAPAGPTRTLTATLNLKETLREPNRGEPRHHGKGGRTA